MPDLREALEVALASMSQFGLRNSCLCQVDNNGNPIGPLGQSKPGEHGPDCWKSIHEDAIKVAEEALAEADRETPLHQLVASMRSGTIIRAVDLWRATGNQYRGKATAFVRDLRVVESEGLLERGVVGTHSVFTVKGGKDER